MTHTIFSQVPTFLDQLMASLEANLIDVTDLPLDHICYRVETEARYQVLKADWLDLGELLSEVPIGNRMIATFKLHEALVYHGRAIDVIELPAPMPNKDYPEGWEHAEFVLDEPLDKFVQRYPHLNFKTHKIQQAHNPAVSLSFGGFAVKFHLQSLENVIAEENKSKAC